MLYKMKKIQLLIISLCVFAFSLFGQSVTIVPQYTPFSLEEMATPLIMATEMHRQAENKINNLKIYIVDVLSKDIDEKLREELNYEYNQLKRLSSYLNENGISQKVLSGINTIYNNIIEHIKNYNDRVAQLEREHEREQKRIAEELERQRKIEESKPKVWSGTGFALNNGYLVTNWHVAEDAQTIHVYGVRGDFTKKYIADVVAKDKINDLAILKISDNDFPGFGTVPYKVKTTTAEVAEEVWVLGFPLTIIMGDEVKYTDGRISALSGFDGDVSMYQISAPIQNGNSGGPVFDNSGNVIGIACAGIDNRLAQNANYAVKASYLKNLVDAMQLTNVMPTASQMANYSRRQDKVKLVKDFVYYIECYGNDSLNDNGNPKTIAQSGGKGQQSGLEWVDLGLPSGIKWATCNVGANYPAEYGNYYAWGEVVSKRSSNMSNYTYLENPTNLPASADVAAKLSNGWRMPTKKEIAELKNYCKVTSSTINDTNGLLFTGPNGNSIFLPFAGYRSGSELLNAGFYGFYWTSSINTEDKNSVWYLDIGSGKAGISTCYREYGRSIRPVYDE